MNSDETSPELIAWPDLIFQKAILLITGATMAKQASDDDSNKEVPPHFVRWNHSLADFNCLTSARNLSAILTGTKIPNISPSPVSQGCSFLQIKLQNSYVTRHSEHTSWNTETSVQSETDFWNRTQIQVTFSSSHIHRSTTQVLFTVKLPPNSCSIQVKLMCNQKWWVKLLETNKSYGLCGNFVLCYKLLFLRSWLLQLYRARESLNLSIQ